MLAFVVGAAAARATASSSSATTSAAPAAPGLLRCPRLERDPHLRDTAAAEDCANRIGVARHHYTTPDSVEDMEAIRQQLGVEKLTLFGISYGTELAVAYARAYPQHVERLILDSVVDADDRDPFATVNFRAMGPSLKSLCPCQCRGISADPGADLAQARRLAARKSLQAFAYDALGRSHRVKIGPVALLDLMFPPTTCRRCARSIPTARPGRARRRRRAARPPASARSTRYDDLGSPRDFSVARYSTMCETTPLPWDPGTPIDQRAGGHAAADRGAARRTRSRRSTRRSSSRTRSTSACAGRTCRAPPSTDAARRRTRRVPTLILQGGEDLRTPPEWSANVAARIPGAQRFVDPRRRSLDGQRPARLRGRRDPALRRAAPSSPTRCKRIPTGVPAVRSAPARFESLDGVAGYSRKVGRTLNALLRPRSRTCGSCSRRRR